MKLRALAKINLGLDVTGKREDGYHEVRMVMQTIQMYDQLEIKERKEPGIRLTTNLPFLPCNDGNLVYKAAKILMDEFDIRQGVDMNLTKFIPVAAGMAGGSSDAAAALVGINRMFQLGSDKTPADGAGCADRSGCSVLCDARYSAGRRNRRKADIPSRRTDVLRADRKTGHQCFDEICLWKPAS